MSIERNGISIKKGPSAFFYAVVIFLRNYGNTNI
jgi:hypothetical protein